MTKQNPSAFNLLFALLNVSLLLKLLYFDLLLPNAWWNESNILKISFSALLQGLSSQWIMIVSTDRFLMILISVLLLWNRVWALALLAF